MKWSFFEAWNESVEAGRTDREMVRRDYIYASELGGAYLDRYYKMQGIAPTNPPDYRAHRKFEAGNIWEWIVGLVLKRAGLFIEEQDSIRYQYTDLLMVSGRSDFIAGGTPDWKQAQAEIALGDYPDIIKRSAGNVIRHLSQKYPEGMEKIVLEVKSTSQYMFDKYLQWQASDPKHRLQLFHYLKGKDMPEGHVVYICRDDCRMLEIGIENPSPVEDEYKSDIQIMSDYWNNQQEPEKEAEVVFMDDTMRFAANWKVEYSNYLTKIYGYEHGMEFRERWSGANGGSGVVGSWNRVFKRVVDGANMTKLNLAVIEDIKAAGFDIDYLVEKARARKNELGGEEDGD